MSSLSECIPKGREIKELRSVKERNLNKNRLSQVHRSAKALSCASFRKCIHTIMLFFQLFCTKKSKSNYSELEKCPVSLQ